MNSSSRNSLPEVLTLIGAYGRDASLADWHEGKDFKIFDGPYTSKRDLQFMREHGVHIVQIVNHKGQTLAVYDLRAGCL